MRLRHYGGPSHMGKTTEVVRAKVETKSGQPRDFTSFAAVLLASGSSAWLPEVLLAGPVLADESGLLLLLD
jgi:hypothetical protein